MIPIPTSGCDQLNAAFSEHSSAALSSGTDRGRGRVELLCRYSEAPKGVAVSSGGF